MQNRTLSRRAFLRYTALGAGSIALAACAAPAAPAAAPSAGGGEAPAAAEIVLEVVADTPEYQNQHQQIADLFSEVHPGARVNWITHSEDGQAAYVAKVAGGYLPAMETCWASGNTFVLNNDTYEVAVDLSTIDYPYWDQFLWDIKNTWPSMYGQTGPRCIDPFLGVVMTWQFHRDLLDVAGLNPIGNVKTWDDLKTWLDEGTKWANAADSPVDRFYDQGWLNPWFGWHLQYDTMPLAFPEGQREHQLAIWKGEKKFNAEDSPYRRYLEFYVEAYEKGWLPESFWTRTWEADMESSFAAKKSAVMLHGPWTFDKTMAIDPTAQMDAFPATPPAEGQAQWMQLQSDPGIDTGSQAFFIRAGNEKKPEWETIREFFVWWNSPDIVRLRSEALGFMPGMKLDPPAGLKGGQWDAITSQIDVPGGKFENVKWERSVSGETQMNPKRKGGSPGVWDKESGNIAKNWADMMTKQISVQDYLDRAQQNYDLSYA
ncbi:MAG: carbohydrate ABC transporter substrate-binding protein [Caldilineaceae bacterium]|nr:carbohydrate ABC transporter substrate-binding protein [Caldilineaceae bacterium]